VRYARHPLLNDEVREHIAQGKQPTRLALHWDDRVQFVLTDALQLKKLAFEDHVLEQAKAQDQRADDFDGSVLMATTELTTLIDDVIDALDGLPENGLPKAATAPARNPSVTTGTAHRMPAASNSTGSDDPPF